MGIESKERTIDGVQYTVTQFPARKGLKLKFRLARLLAPSLGPLFGSVDKVNLKNAAALLNSKIDPAMVGKAFGMLFASSDPDQLLNLVMTLLCDTRREGLEIDDALFDREFAANYGHLYSVLSFVLDVNYSNLLRVGEGLASIMNQVGGGAESTTQPSEESSSD